MFFFTSQSIDGIFLNCSTTMGRLRRVLCQRQDPQQYVAHSRVKGWYLVHIYIYIINSKFSLGKLCALKIPFQKYKAKTKIKNKIKTKENKDNKIADSF